ncbi:MAG: HAD-IIA family hydrolase [Actinomycetota bacterium]|nr:HAD-IIA family hydrolase [Actinomycetota bacterium]
MPDRRREIHRLAVRDEELVGGYDVAMLDLDGVVYRGGRAVTGAPEHVEAVRSRGLRIAFVTNNASRSAAVVAAHLRQLGVAAHDDEVVTSAQAVARLLADRFGAGARILCVGGDGLRAALADCGLRPVAGLEQDPIAVVQGFGPQVGWADLAEASYAVAAGLAWYASNTDRTVPTSRGTAPGNGMLVEAVAAATRARPEVAGKPEPALFDEAVLRVGGTRPLVIGDRLDTDIEGANRVGADSLLVLTGVTGLDDLTSAPPSQRPTFVAPDLGGLWVAHPRVSIDGGVATCGGFVARVETGVVRVRDSRPEASARNGHAALVAFVRAVVGCAWHHADSGASPPSTYEAGEAMRSMMGTDDTASDPEV